ncbi:SAM-dependent methyltransferase, partial [Enterococcus hirae]
MANIRSGAFDTVLCTQVLEHVRDPKKALQELPRVLRPGGVLILSAPHLSMVHDAPHDYFRYTGFGLAELLDNCGFRAERIVPT